MRGTHLDGNGGTKERQLACQQAKCRETYTEKGVFEGQAGETSLCQAIRALRDFHLSSLLRHSALALNCEVKTEYGHCLIFFNPPDLFV